MGLGEHVTYKEFEKISYGQNIANMNVRQEETTVKQYQWPCSRYSYTTEWNSLKECKMEI